MGQQPIKKKLKVLNEENFRELLSRPKLTKSVMPQEEESKGYKFCFSRVLFNVT
jgi:hypothetical protein